MNFYVTAQWQISKSKHVLNVASDQWSLYTSIFKKTFIYECDYL